MLKTNNSTKSKVHPLHWMEVTTGAKLGEMELADFTLFPSIIYSILFSSPHSYSSTVYPIHWMEVTTGESIKINFDGSKSLAGAVAGFVILN